MISNFFCSVPVGNPSPSEISSSTPVRRGGTNEPTPALVLNQHGDTRQTDRETPPLGELYLFQMAPQALLPEPWVLGGGLAGAGVLGKGISQTKKSESWG